MSQAFGKPFKEQFEHMIVRGMAMSCVVANQCRCSETDLLAMSGQVFVFDADCPCGEPADESWPFRVVGRSDFCTMRPASLSSRSEKRDREGPGSLEGMIRKQLRHMSPVAKEKGSAMAFYLGRAARRPGDGMLRIVCAAFERPEKPGVVEVTILSVERVSGGPE